MVILYVSELEVLAQQLLIKMPDTAEYSHMTEFLHNTIQLLSFVDVTPGAAAGTATIHKLIPYVQTTLTYIVRCVKVSDSYILMKNFSGHCLITDKANIKNVLNQAKTQMFNVNKNIEALVVQLDILLKACILDGYQPTFSRAIELAFTMNRISAKIKGCEECLKKAHMMIDVKSFVTSALCLGGICGIAGQYFYFVHVLTNSITNV